MKDLIIVESPTKAKTIRKLLHGKVSVISSKGHIMDLPKSRLGVEIKDNNFYPEYIKIRGKAKDIKEIQKKAKNARKIYLAPDPDREGEAIAYHLAQVINHDDIVRIRFYEITSQGVKKALKSPGAIDNLLVDAHKTRRVLDRLVGYKVSPLLWKMIRRGLSAGRVQTVALRILAEREKEIEAFKPEAYWTVKGIFEVAGEQFEAELLKIDGKKADRINEEQMLKVKKLFANGMKITVSSFVKDEKTFTPLPPFKTSTLQQEASTLLRFAPRRTMRIAQSLYEGVTLERTTVGLITYMRTDSLRIAPEFIETTKGHIIETIGQEYANPRAFKDKKDAQAAHEAIRPTGLSRTPDFISSYLEREAKKLYDIIYRRYLASQMSDSRYERRVVEITHEGHLFRARSLKQVFDGFEKLYLREKRETDIQLPVLKENDELKLVELIVEKKQTQPPARFTEASLIRRLEANGIGRPSTYAAIMGTLASRHYVTRERSTLIPTELGILVNDLLIPRFKDLFNVEFTRKMEEELDQVAEGTYDWQKILREFWEPFSALLEKVEAEIPEIKQKVIKETGEVCPKCGKPLIEKWGRFGKFHACSGFPECRYTKPMSEEQEEKTEKICPECGAPMVIKVGKFGRFLACSRYPECKYTSPYILPQPCPLCSSDVLELRGKRGKFYKCSSDDCVFSSPYPLSDELCEKCNNYMVKAPKETYCVKCNPEKLKPKPKSTKAKKTEKKTTAKKKLKKD